MTEDIRADIEMVFFALLMLGSMAAVIIWDANSVNRTKKAPETEEHSALKCVVTPLEEPPANCLPPWPDEAQTDEVRPDDGILPEIPCEPQEIEIKPGMYYDHIPEEFKVH